MTTTWHPIRRCTLRSAGMGDEHEEYAICDAGDDRRCGRAEIIGPLANATTWYPPDCLCITEYGLVRALEIDASA